MVAASLEFRFSPTLSTCCGRIRHFLRQVAVAFQTEDETWACVPRTPARQHQIGRAKQRAELGGVLGQFPVVRHAMLEQALHDVEAMFDFGAQAGLYSLQPS